MKTDFEGSVVQARKVSARLHASRKWEPLKRGPDYADDKSLRYKGTTNGVVETYTNDLYEINVRRFSDGFALDPASAWIYIGIASTDGKARHDWREMQRIKNEIAGPEWEAIELFPAESRLMDPSNYFVLFCAPKISIGRHGIRNIAGPSNSLAPQRPFAPGEEPPDSGEFLKRKAALRERRVSRSLMTTTPLEIAAADLIANAKAREYNPFLFVPPGPEFYREFEHCGCVYKVCFTRIASNPAASSREMFLLSVCKVDPFVGPEKEDPFLSIDDEEAAEIAKAFFPRGFGEFPDTSPPKLIGKKFFAIKL